LKLPPEAYPEQWQIPKPYLQLPLNPMQAPSFYHITILPAILNPAEADSKLTRKLKEAGNFLEIPVLDHIIITSESYLSMADEGLL
jgi:hypothetical protein